MAFPKLPVALAAAVLTTIPAGVPGHGEARAAAPARLLFWSGFEDGVSVSAPRDCYSSGCWQDLVGTDSASGFRWPPKIAGGSAAFQVRSGTAALPSTISEYIVNEIETVIGRTGAPTRALHTLIRQTGCSGTASQA